LADDLPVVDELDDEAAELELRAFKVLVEHAYLVAPVVDPLLEVPFAHAKAADVEFLRQHPLLRIGETEYRVARVAVVRTVLPAKTVDAGNAKMGSAIIG
jgi:hypothetical protein